MMMKLVYYLPILWLVFLTGCYEKEDDITPTEGTEEIFPLPQGDHDYDDQIVEWHDKYGFYALYIFEDKDLYWANTEWLEGFRPEIASGGSLKGKAGDPDYVGQQLEVIKELFLNNYPDELIEKGMNLRLLLCSELWYTWNERTFDEAWNIVLVPHYDFIWCARGWDHIAVNGACKDITALDRDTKIQFSSEMNSLFLEILGEKKLFSIPEEFFEISEYKSKNFYGTNLFKNGYLKTAVNSSNIAEFKENDVISYFNLMGHPLSVLEGVPEEEIDDEVPSVVGLFNREEGTLCKQKYDILLKCLKDAGVNMDKIQYPLGE